jgi:hypothetical protein
MNENLRRAVAAVEAAARTRLEQTADDVLRWLEADQDTSEPESPIDRLDRQAQDIAEDLRRAERLMRERTGRE